MSDKISTVYSNNGLIIAFITRFGQNSFHREVVTPLEEKKVDICPLCLEKKTIYDLTGFTTSTGQKITWDICQDCLKILRKYKGVIRTEEFHGFKKDKTNY
jgi:hypothetical protein